MTDRQTIDRMSLAEISGEAQAVNKQYAPAMAQSTEKVYATSQSIDRATRRERIKEVLEERRKKLWAELNHIDIAMSVLEELGLL